MAQELAPPIDETTVLGWLRKNLFYSIPSSIFTVVLLALIVVGLSNFIDWALLSATFVGEDRNACTTDGACWAFISARFDQFMYGLYPKDMYWRANLSFIFLVVALLPVLWEKMPYRRYGLLFTAVFPFLVYILIWGGWFGIEELEDRRRIGGFMLTFIIGVTGISLSLPLGILLAMGRRSNMFIVSTFSTIFIEFIRGVPLITLLFIASTMLNYFLPPGTEFDLLMRVLIMVTLFTSGYMAEVIRGGFQAIPVGQWEGAGSLGLGYGKTVWFIILPQVLKISIPGIVNTFIGLFKDTTLVVIIGLLDPLGIGNSAVSDIAWKGLSREMYIFLAVMFFIFCFLMSRYSQYLERKLDTNHRS